MILSTHIIHRSCQRVANVGVACQCLLNAVFDIADTIFNGGPQKAQVIFVEFGELLSGFVEQLAFDPFKHVFEVAAKHLNAFRLILIVIMITRFKEFKIFDVRVLKMNREIIETKISCRFSYHLVNKPLNEIRHLELQSVVGQLHVHG